MSKFLLAYAFIEMELFDSLGERIQSPVSSRSEGSATRVYRPERHGAERSQREPVFGSRFRLSWSSRGSDQAFVVVGRWAVPFREEVRTREIHLATGDKRNGIAEPGTAFDVA